MKKILLLLIIPFLSFGQGWEQVLGTGYATSAQQTTDGGYIIIQMGKKSAVIGKVVHLLTNSPNNGIL